MSGTAVIWMGACGPQRASWSRLLSASGIHLTAVAGLDEALSRISRSQPDVILLTVSPGLDLAATISRIASAAGTSAKIVAVIERPEAQVSAMMAGAHDTLSSAAAADDVRVRALAWARVAAHERQQARNMSVLAERLRAAEDRLRDVLREANELRELAHRDELTGLGNRRSFRASLDYAIEYALRYGGQVSVVVADLDGMKALNDRHGHPAGDVALKRVADTFRASLRTVDHAARLGGDEFGVVMPATPAAAAAAVAERIRGVVAELVMPGRVALSASFGVATLTTPRGVGFCADEIFSRADAALYSAKRGGKNRVEVDGPEQVRAA